MSVKIIYKDAAIGAEEKSVIYTNDATEFSEPALLPFGVETEAIATLEPNQWLPGYDIFDNQTIAFWSTAMSGDAGEFAAPPLLKIDMNGQYTSPGIQLQFDPSTGNYCSSVTIRWYRGEQLLDEVTFEPDKPVYFCRNTVIAYSGLEIQLNATNLPHRYARLSQILFGIIRQFERDELRSVKITLQASIISTEAAINTLDFELNSKSDVEFIFQKKQPVFAYDGDDLVCVFYINDSFRRGQNLYNVSTIDAIGVLDEEPFPATIYTDYPAKQLLEDIINGSFELEMESSLESAVVSGYIPDCTRREALHHVVFAICAMIDTSGGYKIWVFRPPTANPKVIPPSRTYTGGSVSTAAIVTEVRVTAHTYSTSGDGSDVVEVDGVRYYHTESVTSISNPEAIVNDKRNVVEIKDATLVSPSNVAAVAQNVYDYYMRRNKHSVRIVMDGERPGDYVTTTTPWGGIVTGNISAMGIVLSGIAAAQCEVIGA